MTMTVGDFLLQRLDEWGVGRIYGYPGDGINGILAAMRRQDRIDFVQTRHEELAAFMACAHAKYTGEVGVCMATSGPGAIHLLNGLYDAKLDHQPVVAIVGQQKRASLGGHFQQEVDLVTLFKDVAGAYVQMATTAEQIRHLVDRAFRIARTERCVTCIIIPSDLQDEDAVTTPPRQHGSILSGIGSLARAEVPPQAALQAAADILNAGKKVAILAGAGAHGAADELVEVARLLGAGIAKALLGKMVVADDQRFVTGSIGIIGTQASFDMMNGCDTLLMVGSSFPYSEFLPEEGQARGVQIDIDGKMLSLRYPMEANLIGDARATLRALIPLLERKQDRSWQQGIETRVEASWRLLEEKARMDTPELNPQRAFWELSQRLPDDAILAGDSGSSTSWYALDIKARTRMLGSLSGGLATMGSAVPYAFAAKMAYPGRLVVALVGDGAMQMNGMNCLITIARTWQDWSDPRLIVLVLNNRDLNFVTWEQRGMAGEPKYETSQELPDVAYADYARLLGLDGARVERPDQLGAALDAAFNADKPFVLDIVSEANIPPLPPHITRSQARKYFEAIEKGEPEADAVRRALAQQGLTEQ
ncbi:thiamine pyrophosphate-requiring protein [Massilia sp.]|uniref:thiamine pyrophosphate-requiring protein n=1 Tax=Massilia sp. TaxID=1882437 RepID=UPI0028A5E999|nr:thiamine pyrophosphate-requiring protein [Massilia sp.]